MPAEPADAARLLVVRGAALLDDTFAGFASHLRADDVLVINDTRVIRARLKGRREPGGGAAEVLLLRPEAGGYEPQAREWRALVRPGRRLHAGSVVTFGHDARVRVTAVHDDGSRTIAFEGDLAAGETIERYGALPLPPYVGPGDAAREARYQTIFARVPGSVAAPTASLHFTPRVLASLAERGIETVPLTLDVGYGTFKPMEGDGIDEHRMHAERYEIPAATAAAVNAALDAGRRIVVAGTTALRALEASAAGDGRVHAGAAQTEIFITPGFPFRVAGALLTNFHLPASTLLVLVSAFAGYDRVRAAYAHAVARGYRFYSFGDAMLLERDRAAGPSPAPV